MEGEKEYTISYRPIDTGRHTKHETLRSSMSTYENPERNFTMLTSPANPDLVFEFLKDKTKDYLVSPFFINHIHGEQEDHVETHVVLESAVSYGAWIEKIKGKRAKNKEWKTAKQLLGVFDELMESLVKAHEDGYTIHEWTDVFVYPEQDKSRIPPNFKYEDLCVRSCKFTYLDVGTGPAHLNRDLDWFCKKVWDFLLRTGYLNLAPPYFKNFLSAPSHYFVTPHAMDCPFYWKSWKKVGFIHSFASCIVERRFDQILLSQAMDSQNLMGWQTIIMTEPILSKFPRFYTILTTHATLGKAAVPLVYKKYRGTCGLVTFSRYVISHYSDRVGRTENQLWKEKDEVVDALEDVFEELTFKLWLSLGEYFQQCSSSRQEIEEIEKIIFTRVAF